MKLKLETKYHGEQVIDEKDIITFENGVPGFLEETEFVIFPYDDDSVFFILQSVKTAGLAFVIVSPFVFFKDYDFNLDESVVEALDITSEKEVAVFVILTVKDPFQQTTANLQAPVIFNVEKKMGKQVILTGTSYETRHIIFQEVMR